MDDSKCNQQFCGSGKHTFTKKLHTKLHQNQHLVTPLNLPIALAQPFLPLPFAAISISVYFHSLQTTPIYKQSFMVAPGSNKYP